MGGTKNGEKNGGKKRLSVSLAQTHPFYLSPTTVRTTEIRGKEKGKTNKGCDALSLSLSSSFSVFYNPTSWERLALPVRTGNEEQPLLAVRSA